MWEEIACKMREKAKEWRGNIKNRKTCNNN
jgi:hypothetical protein